MAVSIAVRAVAAAVVMAFDGDRVWLSNGLKIVVLDQSLELVRAEIVLPEPIVDLHVRGDAVYLVHLDHDIGRVRVARWEIG